MDTERWEQVAAFHGHKCPGLAIGFRAVEAAERELGIGRSGDEEVVCVTENDACGVDAVQVLLSCTAGKGNLTFKPTGKMAFSFFERGSGKSVRVYLKAQNDAGASREEWQHALLTMPLDEVFAFSDPGFDVPEQARLFASVTCAECGEMVPEHRARMQNEKLVCLDCFNDYDRGWFK